MRQRLRVAVAAALGMFSTHCGPLLLPQTPDELRAEVGTRIGPEAAAALVIPFEVSESDIARARDVTGGHATTSDRTSTLFDALFAQSGFGLRYVPVVTATARDALARHEGNCLTLASVFVGLARGVGLDAYYLDASRRVGEVETDDEVIVNMGHITAAVDTDRGTLAMDFGWELPRGNYYRRIDDLEAVAHFYNNRGFERLDDAMRRAQPLDWTSAKRDFVLATEVMPEFTRGWNNLGIANARLGNREEAERDYARAISIDPAFAAPRTNLGVLALRDGRTEVALVRFDEALRAEPKNARAYYHRGVALLRLGRPAEAASALARALALEPDFPRAQTMLDRAQAQIESPVPPESQLPSASPAEVLSPGG